jgi:hypothetical protein
VDSDFADKVRISYAKITWCFVNLSIIFQIESQFFRDIECSTEVILCFRYEPINFESSLVLLYCIIIELAICAGHGGSAGSEALGAATPALVLCRRREDDALDSLTLC